MVKGCYGYRLLCQIDEIFHSLNTDVTKEEKSDSERVVLDPFKLPTDFLYLEGLKEPGTAHFVLRQIDRNRVIQVISDPLPGRDGYGRGPK